MRICIVTPRHLSANPRVIKEATALASVGYEIHIVHGHYAPRSVTQDAELADPAWTTFKVPSGPRLTSSSNYIRQTIVRRSMQLAAECRPLTGWAACAAIEPVAIDLAAATATVPADLYIAHYVAALPAAVHAARRYSALFAFDAEDFHPGDLPNERRFATTNRIIDAIERRNLPNAAYVTAASPGIADAYAARYGIPRPAVVLNVFPKAEAPPAPTSRGVVPGPSLYWFSQTRGTHRGLECALEAIARAASRPRLVLRGDVQAGFDAAFLARAEALGCRDRVELLKPEIPSRMIALAARYDAGLVGETGETENRRIALTNKQFTYLLAGVPAVMSDIPAHVRFAAEAREAVLLYRNGDAADLASALDNLFLDPDRLAAARAAAWRLGQEKFNFEAEAGIVTRLVTNALAGHGPRGKAA